MSVTVQSRQYSPVSDGHLVEGESVDQELAIGRQEGRQRDDDRRGDEDRRDRDERRVATTLGEVPSRGLRIPGFLGEPAQARGDLRLVGGRCPPVGLAIRLDRPVQVAMADPGRRDVPPGQIGRWCLAQLGRGLPRREGRVVLIESIARLAEAEQCRRGQRRIVEPDDPAEEDRCVAKIARRQGRVGAGQQGSRLVAGQPPGP